MEDKEINSLISEQCQVENPAVASGVRNDDGKEVLLLFLLGEQILRLRSQNQGQGKIDCSMSQLGGFKKILKGLQDTKFAIC